MSTSEALPALIDFISVPLRTIPAVLFYFLNYNSIIHKNIKAKRNEKSQKRYRKNYDKLSKKNLYYCQSKMKKKE